jgi:hypothetical protein
MTHDSKGPHEVVQDYLAAAPYWTLKSRDDIVLPVVSGSLASCIIFSPFCLAFYTVVNF